MKRGMFVAMAGMLAVGWLAAAKNLISVPADFHRLVNEAEKYESEELYIRAIDSYKEALTFNPDSMDVQLRIARDYLAVGDEKAFTSRCEEILSSKDYPVAVVSELADFYIDRERNESAITLLKKSMKYHKNNEELTSRYEKVRYTYKDLYINAEEIGSLINGSAVFVTDGRYGIMTNKGGIRVRNMNEWCGPYSSDETLAPVLKDGEFYFADTNGYRYEVPAKEDKMEKLGILTDDIAPAKINGKYGYVNEKFEHLSEFQWDEATQIQDGIGAVKQGEKWALINEKMELKSDYLYDDVKTDENGFSFVHERAFVKNGDAYQLIDKKGNVMGSDSYEDAVPFASEQPAAVKKNGKWGFLDADGTMVIEPQYEEAGSFAEGLAPVKTAAGWGYINQENALVIEDEFMGAKNFYKGVAPVKEGNYWTMIELNVKN